MPTISFSLKDLEKLTGKKINLDELQELARYGKGDFESYDKETDEAKIDFGDTNLPYLWSVEGFARLIRLMTGKQKGKSKLKVNKGNYSLIVDSSVAKVRPYIAAFVAKGHRVDEYLLKQIIQLQEKLCENFGSRRQKVAIGVYKYSKINFPVHYKATSPESVKFIPLDYKKEMTQQEILEEHPKGKEYSWILEGFGKYPILVDDKNQVLSFPPIINSLSTGKIEQNDEDLFFEATGTDLNSILLASNIFAQALFERGFKIYSVKVEYPDKKLITPSIHDEKIKVDKEIIKKLLGLDFSDAQIGKMAEKAGYDYEKGYAMPPHYRQDILHAADVVEDIAIVYGYDKIEEMPLKDYTVGSTRNIISSIDRMRELLIGLGFQEIFSPILTNKSLLYEKANIQDTGTIEIKNFMSENYSVVRSWLVPILLECLSKNKHIEYPQKIFEQGLVTVKSGDTITDYERIAVVSANEKADFTEIKQVLDYLMSMMGFAYKIEDAEHGAFINGRVGRAIVDGKKVAYIGEIHPKVLENFGIEMPVAGFELNITELYRKE